MRREIFISDMGGLDYPWGWKEEFETLFRAFETGTKPCESGDRSLEETGRLGLETILFSVADNLDHGEEVIDLAACQLALLGHPPLILHGPFLDLNPACFDSRLREVVRSRFDQAYAAAKALGAQRLIFHSGRYPAVYRFDEGWEDQAVSFWTDFMDHKSGISVCLENVLDERPLPLRRVADRVGHPDFGLCLDLGHALCYSPVEPEEWIQILKDRICHVHLHDNDGRQDQHKALGEGILPWDRLLSLLPERATCTIECAAPEELGKSIGILNQVW